MTSTTGVPGAVRLRDAIARRELSPVEAVTACLTAIGERNHELNAFLAVDPEGALDAARRAEAALATGAALGPLHGVPVGVKDVEATADLVTTFGSARFAGHRPHADSPLVAALRSAGAIVVGKTNTPAFALLGETYNDLGDDCRNPCNTDLTSGGSSGGSAVAVAAGLVPLATGTDYGGSINAPAGFCGVVGFKASQERVAPLCPVSGSGLLDAIGPLARSVEDVELFQHALGLLHDRPADARGVRVLWSPDLGRYPTDPEVRAVAETALPALRAAGCRVVSGPVELPDPWDVFAPLSATDVRLTLHDMLGTKWDGLTPETWTELAAVPELTVSGYAAALRSLAAFRSAAARVFGSTPVVATPATAVPAFPVRRPPSAIDGRTVTPGWHSYMPFQVPWNLTGSPVLTLPAGLTGDGRPVGLQLAAAPHHDELLLAMAAAYERVRGGLP